MKSMRQPKESFNSTTEPVVEFLKKHERMIAQIAKKKGLILSEETHKGEFFSAAYEAYNDTLQKMRRREGVKFENVFWFYLHKRLGKVHKTGSLFLSSTPSKDKPKCPKCGSKNLIPASIGWAACQNVKCGDPEPFTFPVKPNVRIFSLDAPLMRDEDHSGDDLTALNVMHSEPISGDEEDSAITTDTTDTAGDYLSSSLPYSFYGLEGHMPIDAMHTLHVLTCDVQPNGKERKEYMAEALGIPPEKFYLQVKKAIAAAKKSSLMPFKVIVSDDTNAAEETEEFVWDVRGGYNIPKMKKFEGKKILKTIPLYGHTKSESKDMQQMSLRV